MIENLLDLRDFLEAKRANEATARARAADEVAIVAAYERQWFPELASPETQGVAASLGSSGPTGLDDFAALGRTMGTVGYG